MPSSDTKPEPADIRDVAVPPLTDDIKDEFLDGRRFQTQKFARYAQEESGTAGAIGVALDLLSDVEDDLNTLSNQEPDFDAEHFIDYIGRVTGILVDAADQHISDYDSPLYDTNSANCGIEEDSSSEDEKENEEKYRWSKDDFARVSIDNINGKGNILAHPDHLSKSHLHLSHGQENEEVIVFIGASKPHYSRKMQQPVLPFSSIEEARRRYSAETALQVEKGDLVKIPNPTIQNESIISIDGFNVSRIQMESSIPRKYEITVKIKDIEGDIAQGEIEKKTKKRKYKKKRRKKKKRTRIRNYNGSGTQRYNGQGNNKNPFKGGTGTKNNLLKKKS